MSGTSLHTPCRCANCHAEGGDPIHMLKTTRWGVSGTDPALPGATCRLLCWSQRRARMLCITQEAFGILQGLYCRLKLSGCSPQSCCCQDDGPSAGSQPVTLPAAVTIARSGLVSRFPDAFLHYHGNKALLCASTLCSRALSGACRIGSALIQCADDTKSLDGVSLQDEHPGTVNGKMAALKEREDSLTDEEPR